MAGSFLVDSFWLNSEHHQLGDNVAISDEARIGLMVEQCSDLQEKYGERMGKRLMNCCVLGALDSESKEMLGLVTLTQALMMNGDVLEAEKAEAIAKNAVASLGPKERRMYKDASMDTIATELLSPDSKAVCVISNLAVSAKARRRGIAKTLCAEAEALASDWGHQEMHLLVESENTAARKLYEDKLGYGLAFTKEAAVALRADIESGTFVETEADTLILFKKI
jgi:ribosomal protein S18 acetylase RimI-like enzyme